MLKTPGMGIHPIHDFYALNGHIFSTKDFVSEERSGAIYEVVRVIEGIPLFLADHLDRLFISAKLANKTIGFNNAEIERFLNALIEKNQVSEGNVFIFYDSNLKAFFIPHKYPNKQQYVDGVKVGILNAERKNPNAKVIQAPVRAQADSLMAKNGYFEVLLADHQNRITEGSRSNVFFIRGNKLVTPPANEVLLGVTRKKVISVACEQGFEVLETDVFIDDLSTFDAVFITGTSPKLLPIKKINDLGYDCANSILRQLIFNYDELIRQYLQTQRNLPNYF